jgi:hypothetical protein
VWTVGRSRAIGRQVDVLLAFQLGADNPLFQEPPFRDALDGVLGLGMTPEVAQDEFPRENTRTRRCFFSTHGWIECPRGRWLAGRIVSSVLSVGDPGAGAHVAGKRKMW